MRLFGLKVGFAILLVALACQPARATTYHVSPLGSNTPPFDTYATAANHPRAALAVASAEGDTVFLHPGIYDVDTAMEVAHGVTLLGESKDSVELRWCCLTDIIPRHILNLKADNTISGIRFQHAFQAATQIVAGILTAVPEGHILIEDCGFYQLSVVGTATDTMEVRNCFFEVGSGWGVLTQVGSGLVWVHHNTFVGGPGFAVPDCVGASSTHTIVENNVFDLSGTNFRGNSIGADGSNRELVVRNNLMIGGDLAIIWDRRVGRIENNTIIQTDPTFGGVIELIPEDGYDVVVRNNVIYRSPRPYTSNCSGCSPAPLLNWTFNAYWPDTITFLVAQGGGSGLNLVLSDNLYAFPMFVDDSLYHLQAGSPLIDAGDPSILDADGSRSDLGWTGGPGGIVAAYPELAPSPPDSLTVSSNGNIVELSWPPRPEADLDEYRVYRDVLSGSWTPGLTPLKIIPAGDTTTADTLLSATESYFYVVTAVDTAGLESGPSPEVEHMVTGVFDDIGSDILPRRFEIIRTYPNPFNANLLIDYSIPETAVGQPVTLEVYNVLGQCVASLDAGLSSPGLHQIEWSPNTRNGRPLSSGMYAVRLRINGKAVGNPVKAVLMK